MKKNKTKCPYDDAKVIEKVRETEIEILKEIIRICEKYDIHYFTAAGTTLGAVRHGGFIPWDDDIDIGMARDDYELFLKKASYELDDSFFILNHDINKNFPMFFTKVCKRGTVFLEEDTQNLKYEHSIFVDIFPYDYVCNDSFQREKDTKKIKKWMFLYRSRCLWRVSAMSKHRHSFFARMARFFLHLLLLPVSKEFLYEKAKDNLLRYKDIKTDYIAPLGTFKQTHHISSFLPTRSHVFECIIVNIPNDYRTILTAQYGDFMSLPPESERLCHSPVYVSFNDF